MAFESELLSAGLASAPNIGASALFDSVSGVVNDNISMARGQMLLKQANQMAEVAVDKANKYNSPLAQMNRLREAGLNPNLVYGHGSVANTGSVASTGKGEMSQTPFTRVKNYDLNSANILAQNELLKAQAMKTNAETQNTKVITEDNARELARRMKTDTSKSDPNVLQPIVRGTQAVAGSIDPVKRSMPQSFTEWFEIMQSNNDYEAQKNRKKWSGKK